MVSARGVEGGWRGGGGKEVESVPYALLLDPGTGSRGRVLLPANGRAGRAGLAFDPIPPSTLRICAAA